ncbi:hypothetical protein HG531_007579 [Fusarium graminearum]|nr:hypothetical protein HG531_007579 [Fusarium graminearum]
MLLQMDEDLVTCACHSSSAAGGKELAAVVPGQRLHRSTGLENLGHGGVSLLSKIEDGDHGLSLGCGGEPVAILGEGKSLNRGTKAEGSSLLESIGHEELDLARGGTSSKEVAIGVECASNNALVRTDGSQNLTAGVEAQCGSSTGMLGQRSNLVTLLEDLDASLASRKDNTVLSPCSVCDGLLHGDRHLDLVLSSRVNNGLTLQTSDSCVSSSDTKSCSIGNRDLVHLLDKFLWQLLRAINLHLIAIDSTSGHSDLAQSIPSLISLPRESCNNSHGGIVLVQRCGEFLSGACELLLEVICLESKRVPFVLEGREEGWDGCEGRRTRSDDTRRMDRKEIISGQGLSRIGLGGMFVDVLLDKALLVDNTWDRHDGLLRSLSRNCREISIPSASNGERG